MTQFMYHDSGVRTWESPHVPPQREFGDWEVPNYPGDSGVGGSEDYDPTTAEASGEYEDGDWGGWDTDTAEEQGGLPGQ